MTTDRQALITEWIEATQAAVNTVTEVLNFLAKAKEQAPQDVDALAFLALQEKMATEVWRYEQRFENFVSEELLEVLTGRDSMPYYLEYWLKTDGIDQHRAKIEIEFQRSQRPAAFERLAALYEAKWGVAL